MFDSIGRTRRTNRQRQTGSMLISVSLFSTAVGAMMLVGGQRVDEVLEDEEPVEVFVEVADAAPPPPPPPPPPAASSTPEEKVEEEQKPEEIQEPDEIKQLDEKIPEPVVDAGVQGGVEGGVEGGVVGGVVGGVIGGELGGVLGGQLGGTGDNVKAVHWSQVKPKKRVTPVFPEAAKALGLKEESCPVKLKIDEKGVPYELDLDKCPKLFHEAVTDALMKWRFYPHEEGGRPMAASFTLNIKFQLN